MATFTTDWNEATVADTAQASTLGAVDRANQVNLSDRLKAMIYGFINGENDGVPGCKHLAFKQQSSDATVATDTIALYAKDVSGNNELYTKDEAGNVVQLTSAGTVGAGGVTLLAGKDLIGSATSDITMNTNKFTVAGATGNTVIAGTVAAAGSITLGAGADLVGSSTSDITFATNKFTVAGATGNTVIAGTAAITGTTTLTGGVVEVVDAGTATVFTKYFTGTLDSDAQTGVAHGVTAANILHLSSTVLNTTNSRYEVMGGTIAAANTYDLAFNATYILFDNVGANLQGETYTIKMEYTA